MTDPALHLLVRMQALEGKEEEFRAVLQGLVGPTRGEPGCLSYDLLAEEGDGRAFLFVESWRDEASLKAHSESAHVQAARAHYPGLLDGAPEVRRARRIL